MGYLILASTLAWLLLTFLLPFITYTFLSSGPWGDSTALSTGITLPSRTGSEQLRVEVEPSEGRLLPMWRVGSPASGGGGSKCVGPRCPLHVSTVVPNHGPAKGGYTITITLQGVRQSEIVPNETTHVDIGGRPCLSIRTVISTASLWVVTCTAPDNIGSQLAVVVRHGLSTLQSSEDGTFFSFNAPTVWHIEPDHGPRSGGTVVIVRGQNFGTRDSSPIVSIGGTPCLESDWVSDEAIRCIVPPGKGIHHPVRVKICGCGDAEIKGTSKVDSLNPTFSYDEDFAKRFLPLVFPGSKPLAKTHSMVMNRGLLSEEYEISYNKTFGDNSHLAVPPELAVVLPPDDFSEVYSTCAVVGKSKSLLESQQGSVIDNHEAVFQTNNAPNHRFEDHVGTKTTFQVIDQFWMEEAMNSDGGPQDMQWWVEDVNLVMSSPLSQEVYIRMRQMFPTSMTYMVSTETLAFAASMVGEIQYRMGAVDGQNGAPTGGSSHLKRADLGLHHAQGQGAFEWSSFLHATFLALQVCKHVTVYGAERGVETSSYFGESASGEEARRKQNVEFIILHMLKLLYKDSLQLTSMASSLTGSKAISSSLSNETSISQTDMECTNRPCQLDCSKHGVSRNGVCECDPIYNGDDCSIDRLSEEAEKLLNGMDLQYNGSLTLHKGDIVSSSKDEMFINLPEGITRDKLRAGDIYKVESELYDLLPETDIQRRYGSCALVGNSGAMLASKYGRDIDAHDMVYRFNQGPTKRYKEHVGGRTTMESLNGFWVKQLLDRHRGWKWNWRSKDTSLVIFEMFEPWAYLWKSKTQIVDKDRWWRDAYAKLRTRFPDRGITVMSPAFVSWSYQVYRDLRRRFQRARLGHYEGEKPMSGFYAFLFCLQVCDEVNLYGFQPYRGAEGPPSKIPPTLKYHYFDDAVPRPGSHSFDLAHYVYQLVALANKDVHIYD